MKQEYSQKEMKDILRKEIELPKIVEQQIQDVYYHIGMKQKVPMRYTRKHRWVTAAATAAVVVFGSSMVVMAANKILSAKLTDKGTNVQYQFEVDKTKPAHEIEVTPGYMPNGYELKGPDDPYEGKWHNDETNGSISIFPMNASELDETQKMGETSTTFSFDKKTHIGEITLDGGKADIFKMGKSYIDSGKNIQNIFVFNEEYGYGVGIYSNTDLGTEEMEKIAEGLQVKVLDTTVAYKTDEEIAAAKKAGEERMAADRAAFKSRYEKGVSKEYVKQKGEEVSFDIYDKRAEEGIEPRAADIRYTVEEVQVLDSLSADTYPKEKYQEYDMAMAQWVNADGTLKPHEREEWPVGQKDYTKADAQGEIKTVNSKFVVVKLKAKNYSTEMTEDAKDVCMAPELEFLVKRQDGNYGYSQMAYRYVNEDYSLQGMGGNGRSMPVYFDMAQHTEGVEGRKHFFFRQINPGEEIEYTLAYVVDEDQLDQMYLQFYAGTDWEEAHPYVRISQ